MQKTSKSLTPPARLSGILQKVLVLYTEWFLQTKKLPKDLRYSIGLKISSLFTDVIEQTSLAQFCNHKHKVFYIDKAIAKNDTLKFMFFTLHELKGIKLEDFSKIIMDAEEIGKMLYGWKRKLESQEDKNTS